MGEPWILAVDLGNGGPKVAVVSLEGEVLRVGLPSRARPHRPRRRRHPGRGRVVDRAAGRPRARRSPGRGPTASRLHVVAITGQYGSSVPVGADGEPVGEVLLWADTRARAPGAGGHRRPAQHRRLRPAQGAAVRAHHRRGARLPAAPTPRATRCCCESACARSTRRPGSSSSRWTTWACASPAARPPPRRRCWPPGSPTTASGLRSGTSTSSWCGPGGTKSKLPELLPTGAVLGHAAPGGRRGARRRRGRAGRLRRPGPARRRHRLGRHRALRHPRRHLHDGVDQRPGALQAHRHPAPDRHGPRHRRGAPDRREQPGDGRRRAPLAARADRGAQRRPHGRRQRDRGRGRRRRGPGALVRRPHTARRRRLPPGARACCSRRG